MTRLDRAFRQGLATVLRHPGSILPFFVASVFLGMLQSWPLLLGGQAMLRNPLVARVARLDTDAVVDLFVGKTEALSYVGVWMLIAVALVPVYGLVYNFWSGGIVSVAAGAHSFWRGARRTFWSFTALGLLLILLMGLAAGSTALLAGTLSWGSLGVMLLLLGMLNGVGEYARAAAAVHGRLNPFVLLAQSVRFCLGHLPGVFLLTLVGLLLHATLLGAYRWAAGQVGGGLGAVALEQLTVLFFVGIKAVRLSWATAYMQDSQDSDSPA